MYSFTKSKDQHFVSFNNLMNNYYPLDSINGNLDGSGRYLDEAETFTNIVLDKLKYSDSEIIIPFQTSGDDSFLDIPRQALKYY